MNMRFDSIGLSNLTKRGNYYEYRLGDAVEITTIKRDNTDDSLSKALSTEVKEDNLMLRYKPTNIIYIHKDCIEDNTLSVKPELRDNILYIEPEDVETNGILTLSSYISSNDYLEEERNIFVSNKLFNSAKNKIRILALGLKNDELLALYYIPKMKGIVLYTKNKGGISVITNKKKNIDNLYQINLNTWFSKARIKNIERNI